MAVEFTPRRCCAGSRPRRARPTGCAATCARRSRRCAGRSADVGSPSSSATSSARSTGNARCARIAARHDLLAVEVLDPRDLELPDVEDIVLHDPETGRTREFTVEPEAAHGLRGGRRRSTGEQVEQALRSCGAPVLTLRTDRDWIADVVRFVATRRHSFGAGEQGAAPVSLAQFASPWWLVFALVVVAAGGRVRRRAAPPPQAHAAVLQHGAAREGRAAAARAGCGTCPIALILRGPVAVHGRAGGPDRRTRRSRATGRRSCW